MAPRRAARGLLRARSAGVPLAWGAGSIDAEDRVAGEPAHARLSGEGHRGAQLAAEDVQGALDDGAALAQVYSALIFEGPALIGRIDRGLTARAVS